MTSVLFVGEQQSNALVYYRQVVPGSALARLGWQVRFAPMLAETPEGFLTGMRPGFLPAPVCEVIVTRHITGIDGIVDSSELILNARRQGQRVFYDLDDNLWELPEHNPAYVFYSAEMLAALDANLAACDGVLVSTPTLAEAVRTHTATPVTVAPNGILVDPWPLTHRHRDPVRVGWLGLMDFRADDLAMIREPLGAALEHTPHSVMFVHCGAHSAKGSIRELLGPRWPARIEEVEWVAFHDLGHQLATNVDVAVVPMRPGKLNDSRSPTTGLALAACGIPFLASATPAYRELASRVPGVRLVEDDDDWQHATAELIDDAAAGRLPQPVDMRRAVVLHYRPDIVVKAWTRALGAYRPVPARMPH